MTDRDLEQLAERIAAKLDERRLPTIVDAAQLAEYLGVGRDVVYANADMFGAIRLGDGDRPRLRFVLDAERVRSWTRPRPAPARDESPARAPRRPGRSRRDRVDLLPVRGSRA